MPRGGDRLTDGDVRVPPGVNVDVVLDQNGWRCRSPPQNCGFRYAAATAPLLQQQHWPWVVSAACLRVFSAMEHPRTPCTAASTQRLRTATNRPALHRGRLFPLRRRTKSRHLTQNRLACRPRFLSCRRLHLPATAIAPPRRLVARARVIG
jgi:hypothetical protein